MGKIKKAVAAAVAVSLIGAGGYKGLEYVRMKNTYEVPVINVASLEMEDYTSYDQDESLSGSITTNVVQNIKIDKDVIVGSLLVNVGDDVKKGDLLMTIDTTLSEMELGIAELEHQKLQQELDSARARLFSLQNGGPIEEPSEEGADTGTDAGYSTEGDDYYWPSSDGSVSYDEEAVLEDENDTDDHFENETEEESGSPVNGTPEEEEPGDTIPEADTEEDPEEIQEETSSETEEQLPEETIDGILPEEVFSEEQASVRQGHYFLAAAFPAILAAEIINPEEGTEEPIPEMEPEPLEENDPVIWEEPSSADIGISDEIEILDESEDFLLETDNEPGEIILENEDDYLVPEDENPEDPQIADPGDGELIEELPETPVPASPTPTPAEPYIEDQEPVSYIEDEPETDTVPFYDIFDGKSVFIEGTGTKDDPFVFLGKTEHDYIVLKGSFLNLMKGYNPEGTELIREGGYWYRIEFHENDSIPDISYREESLLSHFLINGGEETEGPWKEDEERILYLADAVNDKEIDPEEEQIEDPEEYDPWWDYYTEPSDESDASSQTITREEAIREKEQSIRDLEFSIKDSELKLAKLRKKCETKELYSKIDGTVSYAGNPDTGTSSMDSFLRIKSQNGYYVAGQVSEMMLDVVKPGTKIQCSTDMGEFFEAEVIDVAEYPDNSESDSGYYMSGNPNASMYSFTASIPETDVYISDDTWLVSVSVSDTGKEDSSGITINKAFVRSENGRSYVMKDVDGVLRKQYVKIGKVDQYGTTVTITGGIRMEDRLAFPYSQKSVEGAKTIEGSLDQLYSDSNGYNGYNYY